MTTSDWCIQQFREAIPEPPPLSVVAWAEANVRLPGSARSERFDSSITPWMREPMEILGDPATRTDTIVGPVQSGKSVIGECANCFWLATQSHADIQYNWENDEKALERWDKRIERILKACPPVARLWPADNRKAKRGLVIFPHGNLTVQGVWQPDNLDSDSIRFQINEEIHNWEPGRLAKAYNRTTAFWNSVIINISNAGKMGDQLHQAYEAGTQQLWEVKCPGCGKYSAMRTRWEDKHPELGGLRYDADGCRRENGTYDYNKLAPRIRYQFGCCGQTVSDSPLERRRLSLSGRYSDPQNSGAHVSNRSYTLEAVSVDYIPWLKLIQEKHQALRAMRLGDPEPWKRYLQERECRFWDPEERPLVGKITLSVGVKKNREGLKDKVARFASLDRQSGAREKGETPYWWLVIRDVDAGGNSLLVFEGKLETDEDAAAVIKAHEVRPTAVVADSGFDTMHVYKFCLKHGYNAIKGSDSAFFNHEDGGRRIFSPERPLHQMVGDGPTQDDPVDEPEFWLYSKQGIRDRLWWLRAAPEVKWQVPDDVSEDYQAHMEAEEQATRKSPQTGEVITFYKQLKIRNDLLVCECYIAMQMEMAGLIGAAEEPPNEPEKTKPTA